MDDEINLQIRAVLTVSLSALQLFLLRTIPEELTVFCHTSPGAAHGCGAELMDFHQLTINYSLYTETVSLRYVSSVHQIITLEIVG